MIEKTLHFMYRSLFMLLLLAPVAAYAQNMGAYPTELDYTLAGGQSESQTVTLTNGTDKKVQYRLYLNDWVRDTAGAHIYYPAGTIHRSCARWISMDKNFVEVQPGQSGTVQVKMQVPDSAGAAGEMKWSMLFIETVQEQDNNSKKSGATINNLLRIGVHIYETPPTVTKKQIKVLELKHVAGTNKDYRMLCENQGDVMLDCKSYLELASVADGKKTKLEPTSFPMFPGQKRYVTFQLPANLAKGKYSALAVVDCGEDVALEAMESTVELK